MKLCGNVVDRVCGGGSVYIIEGNGKSCAFVHVKRNDLPGVRSGDLVKFRVNKEWNLGWSVRLMDLFRAVGTIARIESCRATG